MRLYIDIAYPAPSIYGVTNGSLYWHCLPESEYLRSVPAVGCIIPPLLLTSFGMAALKSEDMLLLELTLFRSNFIPNERCVKFYERFFNTKSESINIIKQNFISEDIILPSGSSWVLAKLIDSRPLFSSFLFSKALAITLCFFSLIGLFEGFLQTLDEE